MKSFSETRLECVRLANVLATAKVIPPKEVIPTAMEFFKWIDGGDEKATPNDVARVAERFRR